MHQEQVSGTDLVEQGTSTYDVVTVKQAAGRSGCSVQTVRRLIRSGRLRADLVARSQGSAWRVMLPIDQDSPVDHIVQTGTSLERATNQKVPGITELVAELTAAHLMIAQRAERLGCLQVKLQQRDEQLTVLQAPQPEPTPEEPALLQRPLRSHHGPRGGGDGLDHDEYTPHGNSAISHSTGGGSSIPPAFS
jgi:excisionase family DNA binding protein